MHHRIERPFDMEVIADIVFNEGEPLMPEQMGNVVHSSGEEIVHADHGMPALQQHIGEMTPEKSSSTCNEDTHIRISFLRFSRRECHIICVDRPETGQG